MRKYILLLLSLYLAILSCQKEEAPSIIINDAEIAISNAGGSQTISFESNMNWTAKSSENWCTVSSDRGGASTKSFTVTAAANDIFDDRSCTVTIMVGGLSKTITINQSANLGLFVSPDKFDLSNDATTIEVEVRSNVEFDVISSDDWISNNSTRSLSSNKLYFNIAKNESYDNRNGFITIKQKDGALTETIKVYQSQKDAIILSNKKQDLSSDSQTLEIELKTNVDFEVIIPEAAKNWVSYIGTRALRTEAFLLNIDKNEDFTTRNTEIYVKNRTTRLQDTLTINQSANLGLFVSPDKFDLSNDATIIEVEVRSNVEFDVISSDDWISNNSTRSLSSSKLYFNVDKNESYDNRNGSITIKQKDGALTETIKVYQSQKDAIILSNKKQDLSSDSQTLEIELKTNVDFEVIIPEAAKNWVSYIGTRALRTETLLLNITENKDNNALRSTEIYVKNKATSLQDTLTIVQEKAPDVPTVTTSDAYDILTTSAKIRGKISNDGGAPILEKGICWSTIENPTTEDSKTSNGLGADDFVAKITNLNKNTKYYARAYATNRAGTAYGNQITFSTVSVVETPVISPNGGVYTTTQTVTITCATEGAQIRYTLDESEPTETSELYNGAILINEEVTIKAKAFKTNWKTSSVATETYIINLAAQLIEGSTNTIQHIDASNDFVFRLNNLNNEDVFFVFSNENSNNLTALPQIHSNVETISTTAKSISFSEPSLVVSGKPSITEFNNNPWKQPMDGMKEPQYQRYLASQPEKLVQGSSEYLNDEYGNPQMSTVRKVISANGKNLYVWVADNCWEQGGVKSYNVTQQMVDALAFKFLSPGEDNDIYEWVTNIAGDPWGPTSRNYLIPETDDIHIWLMDIDNDNKTTGRITVGYYYARDNFSKSYHSTSNEKLMFAIDAVVFSKTTNGSWDLSHYWPNIIISTLAHEFTHMIYFYQHEVLRNLSSNIAINEMSAQCVEDLIANKILADGPRGISYATSNAGSTDNDNGRLPLYNKDNDYNLLDWSSRNDQVLLNYSKTYALGAYLMRNYGGANFIRELIQNNYTGVNSIVDAVNSNGGGGLNYGDILQKFGAANLLSDQTNMATGYKFNTGGWSKSTINGITYDLGSINLYNYSPTPYVYNQLPSNQKPSSNVLYKAGSNLRGKKEWYFKGMNNSTKLTVVIK